MPLSRLLFLSKNSTWTSMFSRWNTSDYDALEEIKESSLYSDQVLGENAQPVRQNYRQRPENLLKRTLIGLFVVAAVLFTAISLRQLILATPHQSPAEGTPKSSVSQEGTSQHNTPGQYHSHNQSGPGQYDNDNNNLKTITTARPILHSPCGNNSTEARAAGCHFDIITFAWLHPKCYDSQLSEHFAEFQEWEYFLEPNRNKPLSQSEALTGNYPVLYVSWEYHVLHCTYMWKKMHRSILQPTGLESVDWYIAPFEHTEHCSQMLLSKKFKDDAINTGILVKYPDCGVRL